MTPAVDARYYEKIKSNIEGYRKLRKELELYITGRVKQLLENYYDALLPPENKRKSSVVESG